MKQLLIFLICLSLLIVPAFAVENLDYVFKQGNNSQISRPCYNTGETGYCGASAMCALSVFGPDNLPIVLGKNMTNQIYTHNYTLPVLTEPGVYKTDIACTENNVTGYDSFFFGVNQAGKNYNGSAGPYILLAILALFAALFAYLAFKMETSLKLVFMTLVILLIPVSLWVGLDIARNSFMSSAVINVLSTLFVTSLSGFAAFAFYVLIKLTMQLKINKTVGIPNDNKASPAYWQRKEDYKKKHIGREYD
jgi:hypothetical protein